MRTKREAAMANEDPGDLISDNDCCRELGGVTRVTLWVYSHDPELNFPPVIKLRQRNFRSRRAFNEFKARLIARANDARDLELARQLTAPALEARRRKREEIAA
jgi:hypothetical protein